MRKGWLLVAIFLSGCSSIKNYESLEQPTNTPLKTYVGGEVFKTDKSSDLPNAFGHADVFGGKVDRGFSELRYLGIQQNGYLGFAVVEMETRSNESTMSRYGMSTSTINAQSYTNGNTYGRMSGSNYYGSGSYQTNTTGTVTTLNAPEGHTSYLPPNATTFAIPPSQQQLRLGNVNVMIIGFDATTLTYSLSRY
ncbi:hypothetical protein SC127_10940 [Pantoea sp. T14]|uniref:hypothetical protein n=1 Tax=Pantoea TaxID=53335 RepID=UPI001C0636F8|nr:hypothetical protein [Pantoea bituminis]